MLKRCKTGLFFIRTVKLIRYVSMFDYFIMACEGVYILFILYYLVEETLEILKIRGAYFKSVYNNLDIVVVILSIGNQGLSIYTFFVVENQVTFLSKIYKGEEIWTRFIHCKKRAPHTGIMLA